MKSICSRPWESKNSRNSRRRADFMRESRASFPFISGECQPGTPCPSHPCEPIYPWGMLSIGQFKEGNSPFGRRYSHHASSSGKCLRISALRNCCPEYRIHRSQETGILPRIFLLIFYSSFKKSNKVIGSSVGSLIRDLRFFQTTALACSREQSLSMMIPSPLFQSRKRGSGILWAF